MSINRWMDNQNVIYLYIGILFGHTKEESTDINYNMNEHWKHATWKKPVTKVHMLYYSINMKVQNMEVYWNKKQISDWFGFGAREMGIVGVIAQGYSFMGWWKCSKIGFGNGHTTLNILRSHWIIYTLNGWSLLYVDYILLKLFLKE